MKLPTIVIKTFSVFYKGDKLFYEEFSYDKFYIYDIGEEGDSKKVLQCSKSFLEEHFAYKKEDVRDIKIDLILN